MASSPPRTCARCGAILSGDGLCPRCLYEAAIETLPGVASLSADVTGSADLARRDPPRLAAGQAFGRYRIVRLIARGGMGQVYEAEAVDDGRRVALKLIAAGLTDERDRARFLREGRHAAAVNDPHVVYVYGAEEIDGVPAIAMELLPGGNLRSRIDRRGPMVHAEAVDAILEVIAGLDAAYGEGILHRDVKPSNCLIDADGTIKVGDFGLSVAIHAALAAERTLSGGVHGTPAFAAPEQRSGGAVDLRTDIYGVGATLYFLMTGRPPVDHALDFPDRVPRSLQAIVRACLEADPGRRPASYDALASVLRPFQSTAPSRAAPGWRVLAALIDGVVLSLIALPTEWTRISAVAQALSAEPAVIGAERAVMWALAASLAYFAVTEGVWGRSLGKLICRLRVVDSRGHVPGLARAAIRWAIVFAPAWIYLGAQLTLGLVILLGLRQSHPVLAWLIAYSGILWAGFLVSTATRRASRAALHDRWTQTFVVDDRVDAAKGAHRLVSIPPTTPVSIARIGPYAVSGALEIREDGSLLLGYDERLRRHVWIDFRSSPDARPSTARRRSGRGRLRWLTGAALEGQTWDAYEAPTGAPLAAYAAGASWVDVKGWLLDLARELDQAAAEGAPLILNLDRVWIDRAGAKVLDYPAPSASGNRSADAPSAGAFLRSVIDLTLDQPVAELPLAARRTLREIDQSGSDVRHISGWLEVATLTPDMVPRSRRAVPAAIIAIPVMWTIVATLTVAPIQTALVDSGNDELLTALQLLQGTDRSIQHASPRLQWEYASVEVYVAGKFGERLRQPALLNTLPGDLVAIARQCLDRHPVVSPGEFARASALVRPEMDRYLADSRAAVRRAERDGQAVVIGRASVALLGWWVLGSFILTIARPEGILLGWVNLTLVDRDAQRPGAWRALARALVVGAPIILARLWLMIRPDVPMAVLWACLIVMAVGGIITVIARERGPADWIAGTFVVPT